MRQTQIDAGEREGLAIEGREELRRLRKENRLLREVKRYGRQSEEVEPVADSDLRAGSAAPADTAGTTGHTTVTASP